VRVGLVSPYPWDVPGGVVAHIGDLAESLIERGHDAQVITPVDDDETELPSWVTRAGRSIPVPYNGSVSRILLGPLSQARVRRWLSEGNFDVLHVHSPETFSLSLLALGNAKGPIVATFHASNPRSRIMAMMQNPLQVYLEKLSARIAVSVAARKTIVDHLGGDAVVIPNGVHIARYAGASPLPGWPGEHGAIGFVGRVDEPRKGLSVLLEAWPTLRARRPGLRLLVAGPGDLDGVVPNGVTMLGMVSDADKARVYAAADVYVAPNTGGESFGIVLLEAMAAGTPIVASDLEAYRQVLEHGRLGVLTPIGDADALADAVDGLLGDPGRREALVDAANQAVARYDWSVVTRQILRVYETAIAASTGYVVAEQDGVDTAVLGSHVFGR
jgi:phosphatidyl-myo-inositol alpha-mannosyltransferase